MQSRSHQYFINYMTPSILLVVVLIHGTLLSCKEKPPQTIESVIQKLKISGPTIFDFVDVHARRKSYREVVFLATCGNQAIPMIEKAITDLIDENNGYKVDNIQFLLDALVGNGEEAAYQSLQRIFRKEKAVHEEWERNERLKRLLIYVRGGLEMSVKPPPLAFLKNEILPLMNVRDIHVYAFDVIETATDLRDDVKDADYRICYETFKKQFEDNSLQWDWDAQNFIWRRVVRSKNSTAGAGGEKGGGDGDGKGDGNNEER